MLADMGKARYQRAAKTKPASGSSDLLRGGHGNARPTLIFHYKIRQRYSADRYLLLRSYHKTAVFEERSRRQADM